MSSDPARSTATIESKSIVISSPVEVLNLISLHLPLFLIKFLTNSSKFLPTALTARNTQHFTPIVTPD